MGTPLLDRSQTEIRVRIDSAGGSLRRARRRLRHHATSLWATRNELKARARRPLRKQPFDMLVGFLAILLPLIVLVPLSPVLTITAPTVVLLVGVALATYIGDWTGGLTSLGLTLAALDLFWVADDGSFDLPTTADDIVTLSGVLVCGCVLIWLIRETKTRSWEDRQEAMAARAVATALSSMEASAAAHASGTAIDRKDLHRSLLTAMVSANRAHVGALLLTEDDGETFTVAASYGLGGTTPDASACAPAFVRHVADERRPRVSINVEIDTRLIGSIFTEVKVRSALAAPMITASERLVGVVVTGVLVRHHFTTTEVNRLAALAEKGASTLEAVVGYDEREFYLQEMAQHQEWLQGVITAIPEAVVLARPSAGIVTAQNDAAERLFGELLDADLGRLAKRLSTPDGAPVPDELLGLDPSGDWAQEAGGVELVVERADGAKIPVLVSVASVPGEIDPDPTVVAVFREISVLKEASRLKDEFVSVVSHELRSPLTPILGFVQLVARDLVKEGGHEAQVARLKSVSTHVDRMARLVDDLLDVSKLRAGQLELRRQETDLRELCRDVINDRKAGGATQRLVLAGVDEPVVGHWDGDRMYQVIDNLVSNAIKYSPPRGKITITAGRDAEDGAGWVEVTDQGPGIPAEDRDRVFSAFFRTRDAAKSQIGGLGLGLYICYEVVVAHGGTIQVGASESGGAAFCVRLPGAIAPAIVPHAAA